MASSSNKKSNTNSSQRGVSKGNSSSKRSSNRSSSKKQAGSSQRRIEQKNSQMDDALIGEIGLIVVSILMVILFLCNFGLIGPVGNSIRSVMFGLFGFPSYGLPVLFFVGMAFYFANEGNKAAMRKLLAGIVLLFMFGITCELVSGCATKLEVYDVKAIYSHCSAGRCGGGVVAGSLTYLLHSGLETIGTVLVVLLCSLISIIVLTERSVLSGVKNGSRRLIEISEEDAKRRKEAARLYREEQERARSIREDRQRREEEEIQNSQNAVAPEVIEEKIPRMDKKVSGVTEDTALKKPVSISKGDIHEITYKELDVLPDMDRISVRTAHSFSVGENEPESIPEVRKDDIPAPKVNIPAAPQSVPLTHEAEQIRIHRENKPQVVVPENKTPETQMQKEIHSAEKKAPKTYIFPPTSRLTKGNNVAGESSRELKETAMRLQQTLRTFGVNVTITDISQGPSVTRYELQPEQGVKVSKIVGLADDIKLNLAATDIRIEAPIPGKAAIGIEVPNKENMTVALRDLLESKEFREFDSNLAFAVGKDIAGKTVVTDIAKMPHMLIAGATGSGKSVCINTLIMSILFKAHPDDVKLIMVDPKVVELSVYNGIPHLLIPVVTDPKKASAALHWAVSEMEDRYRKFAEYNVRDLKGYNKKIESMREEQQEEVPSKLPQIVIIVDELADLMMVSPGEVEESICRLAQLARACGIHLIIATQRPSVDVITGLIKANMPSRVAFAVSSGVDSRTILDMVGAEKLLGKGDMLFYPQSYTKPARIQGAFVSDKEVSDVVDFLKNQMIGNTYAEDIQDKINSLGSSSGGSGAAGDSSANDRDEYFAEAGRFIIDKDKASIGMLQRVLKIGFNRAARIMDQLCEYGVVGEEEGTKPRKVLMSMEQFEQLLEEI